MSTTYHSDELSLICPSVFFFFSCDEIVGVVCVGEVSDLEDLLVFPRREALQTPPIKSKSNSLVVTVATSNTWMASKLVFC